MKTIITFTAMLAFTSAISQEVISIDQVFEKALANNFQIKMSSNQQEIADNNVNIGNAGLLPSLSANASLGGNINDTELEFAGNIPPTKVDAAQSSTLSAGVALNYTVFNGLSGIKQYQKLKLNKDAVDLQSRAQIEATLLQVSNAYYSLARAIDQVTIAEENIAISKQRFDRAKLANELGTALRTELLASRVDLTTDSSNYLAAVVTRENAERNLEMLVGMDLGSNYSTSPFEIEVKPWNEQTLFETAKANNASLKNLELQKAMSEKDYEMSFSSLFPSISLNAGYNYSNSQNEAGIVLSQTQAGFNGSVALSYPIFSGFRNQINRQNQKVLLENASLLVAEQEMQLATDISNAWANYEQSLKVMNFEKKNLKSAELNLERSEALYKNGQISNTQFREAQTALTSSRIRIANAEISVKLNELELLRLSGQILSE